MLQPRDGSASVGRNRIHCRLREWRKFETCFNKKPIHNRRDVSQAFEAHASAPYPGFGSIRFTGRSAALRLSDAAAGATLDETSVLDGVFPEGIYCSKLGARRPTEIHGEQSSSSTRRASKSTGQEPR
jgi:hypothetical protein